MHTDQIYIARDGKSGMHVLVRILAVDDIGKDYLPIDPDDFNKLMMARDVRSLVLAARDLGPMYISADILSRRIFIPSHLRQHIEHGVNLAPSDIESLLSECYFDPYALPVETDDMGYRARVTAILCISLIQIVFVCEIGKFLLFFIPICNGSGILYRHFSPLRNLVYRKYPLTLHDVTRAAASFDKAPVVYRGFFLSITIALSACTPPARARPACRRSR